MSHFLWTTRKNVTKAKARQVNKAVKAVDPSMHFIRHAAPGNAVRGWLERPNDGTNNQPATRARSAECIKIARSILG